MSTERDDLVKRLHKHAESHVFCATGHDQLITIADELADRIAADEALLRQALEALQESWRTDKGDAAIHALTQRLEKK